jgi:hypothetical protein
MTGGPLAGPASAYDTCNGPATTVFKVAKDIACEAAGGGPLCWGVAALASNAPSGAAVSPATTLRRDWLNKFGVWIRVTRTSLFLPATQANPRI